MKLEVESLSLKNGIVGIDVKISSRTCLKPFHSQLDLKRSSVSHHPRTKLSKPYPLLRFPVSSFRRVEEVVKDYHYHPSNKSSYVVEDPRNKNVGLRLNTLSLMVDGEIQVGIEPSMVEVAKFLETS